MAAVDDKIAATGFTASTTLSFDQVRAAAESAARQADGLADRFSCVTADNGRIAFVLKRAKLAPIGDCEVRYSPQPDGNARVSFVPGAYVRSRTRVFFIPVAPWESSALRPFQRFSTTLRKQVNSA